MSALTYVIIGLLAVVDFAAASICGITAPTGTCHSDYTLIYADSPIGPTTMCIKLDKAGGVRTYDNAKASCEEDGGFLAEPVGYLHEAIYDLILCEEHEHEAFWIGGTDERVEDYWEWESGTAMPTGTPHWYPCEPSQPLLSDYNANHACMWEPDFYFFSCTEGIEILAMCQHYPGIYNGA